MTDQQKDQTIDLVICNPASASHIKQLIGFGDYPDVQFNFYYKQDDLTAEPYLLGKCPKDAIVYAHSSIRVKNAVFSMALRVSRQRPDLRFIVRTIDADRAEHFEDAESFKIYEQLVEHDPHPSMPVSVSYSPWDEFFDPTDDEEGSFKHYVTEYLRMRTGQQTQAGATND